MDNHHLDNDIINQGNISSKEPTALTTTTTTSNNMQNAQSSLKTIYLEGKSPWGFRIINELCSEDPLNDYCPSLIVSKVRSKSKAYSAGLREKDVILFINDFPTHSLTLQLASDLIESAQDLCLIVSSDNNNNNNLNQNNEQIQNDKLRSNQIEELSSNSPNNPENQRKFSSIASLENNNEDFKLLNNINSSTNTSNEFNEAIEKLIKPIPTRLLPNNISNINNNNTNTSCLQQQESPGLVNEISTTNNSLNYQLNYSTGSGSATAIATESAIASTNLDKLNSKDYLLPKNSSLPSSISTTSIQDQQTQIQQLQNHLQQQHQQHHQQQQLKSTQSTSQDSTGKKILLANPAFTRFLNNPTQQPPSPLHNNTNFFKQPLSQQQQLQQQQQQNINMALLSSSNSNNLTTAQFANNINSSFNNNNNNNNNLKNINNNSSITSSNNINYKSNESYSFKNEEVQNKNYLTNNNNNTDTSLLSSLQQEQQELLFQQQELEKPTTKTFNNNNNNNNLNDLIEQQKDLAKSALTSTVLANNNRNTEIESNTTNNNNNNNPQHISSVREFSRLFSSNHNNSSRSNSSNNNYNQYKSQDKIKHNNNYIKSYNSTNNNNNSKRNYYSATESYGEESDYPAEFESKSNRNNSNPRAIYLNNNNNNINSSLGPTTNRINNKNIHQSSSSYSSSSNPTGNFNNVDVIDDSNRVSFASITLRQPLKDINYFSDTEAVHQHHHNQHHHNHHHHSAVSRFKTKNNNNLNTNKQANNNNNNNNNNTTLGYSSYNNSNNNNNYNNNINNSSKPINTNSEYNDQISNINNTNTSNHRRSNSQSNSISSLVSNFNKHSFQPNQIKTLQQFNSLQHQQQLQQQQHQQQQQQQQQQLQQNQQPTMVSIAPNSNSNNYLINSDRQHIISLPVTHGFSKLSSVNYNNSANNNPTTSQFSHSSSLTDPKYPVPFGLTRPVAATPTPTTATTASSQNNYAHHNFNAVPASFQSWTPQQIATPSSILSPRNVATPVAIQDHNRDNSQEDQNRGTGSVASDSLMEKYEREMGSELAKPSKSHYSDSYFYNSSVFNYPTIDDQKKLAKSIADTLEGSNPATSKYHLKKQNIHKQMHKDGYESETPLSPGYYSGNEYFNQFSPSYSDPSKQVANSFAYDESLPDVIKRSIAQASMSDPVRMVQAPDNFKQQHFTEHVTHTQMPPKAAMSLAAALESEQGRGGRGALIFQKRKAKSEKWVVDESNVKKPPVQVNQQPQPKYMQPDGHYPRADEYHNLQQQQLQQQHQQQQLQQQLQLQQQQQSQNNKFSDFNAKPRGWNNLPSERDSSVVKPQIYSNAVPSVVPQDGAAYGSQEQTTQYNKIEPPKETFTSTANMQTSNISFDINPNKLDITSAWNPSRIHQDTLNKTPISVSKDGVQNLRARFYETTPNKQNPSSISIQNNRNQSTLSSSSFGGAHTYDSSQYYDEQHHQQQKQAQSQPQIAKVKLNKLSSHENYLFNNRNALQALKAATASNQFSSLNNNDSLNYNTGNHYQQQHHHHQNTEAFNPNSFSYSNYNDDAIAASDL